VDIVADSGPLISCARAHKLTLIRDVYSKIVIPPSVYREIVTEGAGKPGAEEIEAAVSVWVAIKKPENMSSVVNLRQGLGPGETEAMALAKELGGYILIDEKSGIREARELGLRIKSTLLMLLEAKEQGLISSVKMELDELMDSGFRCSDDLYQKTLALSNEL